MSDDRGRAQRGGTSTSTPTSTPNNRPQRSSTPRDGGESKPFQQQSAARVGATNAVGPREDQHAPVAGFNAAEIRAFLRDGYRQPTDASEDVSVLYKTAGNGSTGVKSAGPWGSKPNTMANGQDFFVQLRKAVATLRQV